MHISLKFAEGFILANLLRLDKYLFDRHLAPSRTVAQGYISEGRVFVNGILATKVSMQIAPTASVKVTRKEKEWVSRGAHKLLQAFEIFHFDVSGAVALDIGASTGGFTQVLLEHGAKKVYSVDVGYGQLAWSLRSDKRVVVMERTNARNLTHENFEEQKLDVIVSDASFISLRLLLPVVQELLSEDGFAVLLVKPQFEAGRQRVGKGVVKDEALHRAILEEVRDFITSDTNLILKDATYSPIKGPEGNIEFLFLLTKKREDAGIINFEKLVNEAHINAK